VESDAKSDAAPVVKEKDRTEGEHGLRVGCRHLKIPENREESIGAAAFVKAGSNSHELIHLE
jgi:hypothetical protein